MSRNLKHKTAHSLKWNVVDRLSTQVLYALTGIVLANLLSQDDFGLVGAVLVFQAFASLLVDSGFSYALLQVLWFNMFAAAALYIILYLMAPMIAAWFQNDARIVPLSRVMFLSLIVNASMIVQTNRLMKAMDVRMVAVSNFIGLALGGVAGIWSALAGYGAWAIVWQTLVMAVCKAVVLWTSTRWRPLARFSPASLKSFLGIGSRMMFTSFLNTVFLNIYSFFIGNRVGMASLGYYTQADKWSKMGVTSITQVLTSTFVPALASVQDDSERFRRMASKMSRFTAYLMFPALIGLMVMARPIFHTLFGDKWDASIILFQLLLFRGLFTVAVSLYNNFLLALGHSKTIVRLEVLRDGTALGALALTFPYMAITLPDNPVYGITILLWGQVAASFVTWVFSFYATVKEVGATVWSFASDMLPYFAQTAVIVPFMYAASLLFELAWLKLLVEVLVGALLYFGVNKVLGSRIQQEVFGYLRGGKIAV